MERRPTVLHNDTFSREHPCLTRKFWGRWCQDCAWLGYSEMGQSGDSSRFFPRSVAALLCKGQKLGPSK